MRDFKQVFRKTCDIDATLSPSELNAIANIVVIKVLPKNEFFVKEGEACLTIGLVSSGVMRHFRTEPHGEVTDWIALRMTLSPALQSFVSGQPSTESIQAITPTKLYCIPRAPFQKLCEDFPAIKEAWWKIIGLQYLQAKERIFYFISKTAKERYKILCRQYPRVIRKQVPQKYFASMLGIELRHLRRISKIKKIAAKWRS